MQNDLFVCVNIIIYVKFAYSYVNGFFSVYNRMRSKEPSSNDRQILTSDSDISSYTLYNEQPNVRHSTSVTSGYQEPVDNIEGNIVNVTDKHHSEPALNLLILYCPIRCTLHRHTLLHRTCRRNPLETRQANPCC